MVAAVPSENYAQPHNNISVSCGPNLTNDPGAFRWFCTRFGGGNWYLESLKLMEDKLAKTLRIGCLIRRHWNFHKWLRELVSPEDPPKQDLQDAQ